MMEITAIVKRKPGRPPKIVVPQHEVVKSDLNISHIIGHNMELRIIGGGGADGLMGCQGPQVVDQSDVSTVDNKDSSPSDTAPKQKGGVAEIPTENKKVLSEDSGITKVVSVNDLRRQMEEYVKGNGSREGLECVCYHCRTFRNRFVEEMRRMLRG